MSRLILASFLFVFVSANSLAVFVPGTDQTDKASCVKAEIQNILSVTNYKTYKIAKVEENWFRPGFDFEITSADGKETLNGWIHNLNFADIYHTKMSHHIAGHRTIYQGKNCNVIMNQFEDEDLLTLWDSADKRIYGLSGTLKGSRVVLPPL